MFILLNFDILYYSGKVYCKTQNYDDICRKVNHVPETPKAVVLTISIAYTPPLRSIRL
jgi:hypothetical protein